jgi:hypothetical protein
MHEDSPPASQRIKSQIGVSSQPHYFGAIRAELQARRESMMRLDIYLQ